MYVNGRGVVQSDQEAVKWFRLAAEQGLAVAQTFLGFMYESGTGVAQSNSRAYVWFSVATAQGHAIAAAPRDALRDLPSQQELEQAQATRCFESGFKYCE
jgi:TPR repeat protein